MYKRIKNILALILCLTLCIGSISACGIGDTSQNIIIPKVLGDSLQWQRSLELTYATGFSVDYYTVQSSQIQEEQSLASMGEYKLISIFGEAQYLIVPEKTNMSGNTKPENHIADGKNTDQKNTDQKSTDQKSTDQKSTDQTRTDQKSIDEKNIDEENNDFILQGLPSDIVVLHSPSEIYLVASQVMDMFVSIDALDRLKFSALRQQDWYIESARKLMETGQLIYAGKYSAPDYELIIEKGCDLAIENTMIYHNPEVKEQLEAFGIPVIVDRSSYEAQPLGRTEWVKLYGALLGKEEEAEEAFAMQVNAYAEIATETKGENAPLVAFFYIAANGDVKVRKSGDYLPKMIQMAGGEYIFQNLGSEEENASSTVNMQMEEFYATAREADFIIYNSTIEGELESVEDLLSKNELLGNFKAVKEGNVFCTTQNIYQSTMELGTIISDIHKMLIGEDNMKYLFQLY